MKLHFLFLCVLWLCPVLLKAQPKPITAYFDELGRSRQHNGNILVADNGHPIINFSAGYADFRTQTPNTSSSRFNLASISKVITATAILQLRDKGRFSIDDALVRYLPDFPYKDIRIRHLLTHTSGLPDLELFEDLVKRFPDTVITNSDVLPQLRKWQRGLYFKPGDEFRYCNTEYNLLALLVEKVSGMPFPIYLKKYIFGPAGMKDTYITMRNQKNDGLVAQPQMKPHPGYDSTFVAVDSISRFRYLTYNNSCTTGQSNVMSTTADMMKFDRAYFKGKLLEASTMQEAMTPVKLNNGNVYYDRRMDTMDGEGKMTYGLGWEIFEQSVFGRSVGHGGFKFGLATFYLHNLTKNQTIIGFDNTAGSEFGRFITSSLSLLNNKPPMVFRTSQSLVTLYGTALVKQGTDHAAAVFQANKADRIAYYLNEGEMNDLGYNLFYMSSFPGHREMALEVFKLATFIFPESYNTYDSYGQLLNESSKKDDAILMYKKSIELNPGNEDGKRALSQLLGLKDVK
ncbi:beta-lactamase family protein [Mucilaginibacter aquariorum]|uniref:Beta-lactamase family protein n=1 Tax=Mucilaginibacter aquariorum TaxID=2967225 RepID=A0ABT1SVG9_9SPHI|nr:beta-lactamase family protein [Mucilaginibacter aquariorum]MCQ6956339.1 beta-lactamase family protein [Mucilaginibacter aquariorum]